MWPKLRRQFDVELEQLHHLLEVHRSLLEKCKSEEPTEIELSALATMLHSFYTGIENILKRTTIELDGAPPSGESWHRDLLNAMAQPTANRPAVISESLRNQLRDYLEFRHVFRHAYSFQLKWRKMSALVLNCDAVLEEIEAELKALFVGGHE